MAHASAETRCAMSDTDLPLAAGFEAPSREAWLRLVEKVLKGGDFEKRLVGRTADGLAIAPLATRADMPESGPGIVKKASVFKGGWDIRQRHAEPDASLASTAILEDLQEFCLDGNFHFLDIVQ